MAAFLRITLLVILTIAVLGVSSSPRGKRQTLSNAESCKSILPCRCRSKHVVLCNKRNCLEKLPTNNMTREDSAVVTRLIVSRQKDMKMIDNDELRNLPRLREVRFYKNKLYHIEERAFENNQGIEKLDLHGNDFREIPTALESLPNLQKINLGGNKISHVPTGFFDSFGRLKSVVLRRNLIKTFPAQLPLNIIKISIDQNELESLPDLRGLRYLHTLKAESNDINSIRFDAFPDSLNELSLCHNNLGRAYAPFDLTNLKELRRLTLTNSRPWALGQRRNLDSFFKGFRNKLRVLSVRGMDIESFGDGFFSDLQRLEVLDMSNNSLVDFNEDWFTCSRRLYAISMAGNPWHCSCDFAMQLKAIKKEVQREFDESKDLPQDERRSDATSTVFDFDDIVCGSVDPDFMSAQSRSWNRRLGDADTSSCRPVVWKFKAKRECTVDMSEDEEPVYNTRSFVRPTTTEAPEPTTTIITPKMKPISRKKTTTTPRTTTTTTTTTEEPTTTTTTTEEPTTTTELTTTTTEAAITTTEATTTTTEVITTTTTDVSTTTEEDYDWFAEDYNDEYSDDYWSEFGEEEEDDEEIYEDYVFTSTEVPTTTTTIANNYDTEGSDGAEYPRRCTSKGDCVFPFTYSGTVYAGECVSSWGGDWCWTDKAQKLYGYCQAC